MDTQGERFPKGLRVLVVDDNLPCLRILEKLLMKCDYRVTIARQATMALKMLREKDKFDIIICDVHMPEMDGFKLLEVIQHEFDIPVLMLSTSDEPELVMKGVSHGAVDYLLKPVRLEELKNIWQHVVRKKKCSSNESDSEAGEDGTVQRSVDGSANSDPTAQKLRVVWTPELHKNFVDVVDQLGLDKALPKTILDLMNVEGLTTESVASHLQKYRIYLKTMTSQSSQQSGPTAMPYGALGSSITGSMLNPYGVHSGTGRVPLGLPPTSYHIGPGGMLNRIDTAAAYRTGLSPTASSPGNGLLLNQNAGFPGLMEIDHFQHPSSNGGSVAISVRSMDGPRSQSPLGAVPPDVKPQVTAPTLQDYTRYMGNWQPGNDSQSTAYEHQMNHNQLPCSGFHTGFPSADVSQIQSGFKRSFKDGSANLSTPNEDLKGAQGSFISYNYIDIYLFFMFYFIIAIYYLLIM